MKMDRIAMPYRRRDQAFTLAEMLTVIGIVILLALVSIVATSPMISRSRERHAARQLHAATLQARHHAIATNSTASLIVYHGERFCVVTDSQYVPVDAPVVLPEGITFRVPDNHWRRDVNLSRAIGDNTAAIQAGYSNGARPVMVLTFDKDGTGKYVTDVKAEAASRYAKPTGGIVTSVGGGTVGALLGDVDAFQTRIEISTSHSIEATGYILIDDEIMYVTSIQFENNGRRAFLVVERGKYTPNRPHSTGAPIFAGGAWIIFFPQTGGVVQVM